MYALIISGFCTDELHQALPNYLCEQAGYYRALAGTLHVVTQERIFEFGYGKVIANHLDTDRPDDAQGCYNNWLMLSVIMV